LLKYPAQIFRQLKGKSKGDFQFLSVRLKTALRMLDALVKLPLVLFVPWQKGWLIDQEVEFQTSTLYWKDIYQQLNILGLAPVVMHMPMEEPADAQTKPTVSNDAKPATQEIEVISKQWAWSFIYPGNVTSNELHLPINERIRLVLNSEDVLHGFYVPEFRFKQDIVPKRDIVIVIDPIRAGKYQLSDSQFSGTYFASMQANVFVESRQAYDQWLTVAAANQPTLASNQATIEHTQQSKKILNSHWHTVQPAEPTIVNYSRSIS